MIAITKDFGTKTRICQMTTSGDDWPAQLLSKLADGQGSSISDLLKGASLIRQLLEETEKGEGGFEGNVTVKVALVRGASSAN